MHEILFQIERCTLVLAWNKSTGSILHIASSETKWVLKQMEKIVWNF